MRKENYTYEHEYKTLSKILANQFQQFTKRAIYYDYVDLI